MTVLIIGAPDEEHSVFIHSKIRARGEQAAYFDSRRFPQTLHLSLSPDNPGQPGILVDGNQAPLPLDRIQAVYWRYHMGVHVPENITDSYQRDMAWREIDSTLGSLFRMTRCRWVNSPEAIQMHAYKTYQLQLLAEAGIRIPHTLVSNDPEAVRAFYEAENGRAIFKPVRGGAHTQILSPDDIKPERLSELAKAPVQFQELIEGVDVRVYLVEDAVFAGEIRSSTLDFREDQNAEIVAVTLPEDVIRDCLTLARLFGLLYTGIDIRRTPAGEYVFLEGNPAPMFMHFERRTGHPISDRLVDLLLKD